MGDYGSLQDRIFSLYDQRKYREALDVVHSARPDFPDRAPRLFFWEACLQTRLGETNRATRTLREGMRRGFWWAPEKLQADPDLDPIRGRPGFTEIVSECDRRRVVARQKGRYRYRFLRHTGKAPAQGTLIALHGRGGNRDETAEQWASVTSAGFHLAAIQSSQIFDMEGFCWDEYTRAEADVVAAVLTIRSRHDHGTDRLILGGFSQGAGLAIHLAFAGRLRGCDGVIAVMPTVWPWNSESEAMIGASAASKDVRTWLLAGEHDERRSFAERLSNALSKRGSPSRLVIRHGIGHPLPPDFPAIARGAVEFVSSEGPA